MAAVQTENIRASFPFVGDLNQSILTKGSRCKLNAKKTIAHDDVTWRATARKIVKKIIDLASQIELTLLILMPRL